MPTTRHCDTAESFTSHIRATAPVPPSASITRLASSFIPALKHTGASEDCNALDHLYLMHGLPQASITRSRPARDFFSHARRSALKCRLHCACSRAVTHPIAPRTRHPPAGLEDTMARIEIRGAGAPALCCTPGDGESVLEVVAAAVGRRADLRGDQTSDGADLRPTTGPASAGRPRLRWPTSAGRPRQGRPPLGRPLQGRPRGPSPAGPTSGADLGADLGRWPTSARQTGGAKPPRGPTSSAAGRLCKLARSARGLIT